MSTYQPNPSYAQLRLPSEDLTADMDFFIQLGFRLDKIFPADHPAVAMLSGFGMHIVLDKREESPPAVINIITDTPETIAQGKKELTAPNGTVIHILPRTQTLVTPSTQHHFEVCKLSEASSWVIGRAGMLYRDLIPDRLGGSIIASHISIPKGGPVPDMVHYHTIGFQLIFCKRGWVKLVYEDQGPPFILRAGDCVTQPPEIRHRVLESSDHLEVIEIGVPAEHMTTIDHELELPTKTYSPDRLFQGQRFCHHQLEDAVWKDWRIEGFRFRESGIHSATQGDASVHVAKPIQAMQKTPILSHTTDILFNFILAGIMQLDAEGQETQYLTEGDAFVIPPNMKYQFTHISKDVELLEVALPGSFETIMH
ncbi:hypothetical protein [uncultured Dokdonia sp.]|uniref:hypothetical protein n=1 Tax=uncultured Dokdonia sp. TaxID=575653 RepID=UPI00261A7E91|nr:hypothetical protein [uncultured Dokdonia sp.]